MRLCCSGSKKVFQTLSVSSILSRRTEKDFMIKTEDLGVVESSFKIELDEYDSVTFLKERLVAVDHTIVDLTKYRGPAYSWKNGIGTLVIRIESKTMTKSLLNLGMLLLRCEPNEYSHLITEKGDVFVRIWWD